MAEVKVMEPGRIVERPLSPHLGIYKPLITMMMSIVHRITGGALYFGTLLVAWWIIAAATSPAAFDRMQAVMNSLPGRVVLLGYTWALLHHMLGGIRHLVWDSGRGLGIERNAIARATLFGSLILTVVVWIIGFTIR